MSTLPKDTTSSRFKLTSLNSVMSKSSARFTLRKRSNRPERETVNLSSYNSDFLSGLFADVAKVTVLTELGMEQKRGSEVITQDNTESTTDSMPPAKKSRISTRFGSCVRSSCMDLNALATEIQSPKAVRDIYSPPTVTPKESAMNSLARHDSLAFQLNCVSNVEDTTTSTLKPKTVEDVCMVAFPQLPTAVSDPSCDTQLTHANVDRQVSTRENDGKDHFGWFVDLDSEVSAPTPPPGNHGLPVAVSCDDLAFQAPTAPKRVNDDAELEWAQAADTVDDVLGDFF